MKTTIQAQDIRDLIAWLVAEADKHTTPHGQAFADSYRLLAAKLDALLPETIQEVKEAEALFNDSFIVRLIKAWAVIHG